MTPNIEIIVGTYEEFLLGYKLDKKKDTNVLTQSFADKSHAGAIKCVAVQDNWIATGATDDRIFIYEMKSRKQTQIILTHEGTINALAFTPDGTHILSGSDDGRMIATRLSTWITEANWQKAHGGSPVTHICCHPSSKLALSLGTDLVLRTWNLVKGRVAYKTNLKSKTHLGTVPECLALSPGGDYFTLSGQRVIDVWSIKTADVVRSQATAAKPVSVCWIADEVCLVGLEDGKIMWITVEAQEKPTLFEAHNSRVKAIAYYNGVVVSASSSGEIKLWHVVESKCVLKEVAATNIGCRPTCIGILNLEQFGAAYALNKTVGEKQKELPERKQPKQQKGGVVTVQYEDDEPNDEAASNKSVDESTSDEDNDAEEATDDSDEGPPSTSPQSKKRKQKSDTNTTPSKQTKPQNKNQVNKSKKPRKK